MVSAGGHRRSLVIVRIEQPAQIGLRIREQVAVGGVDLSDRGSHDPGEVEELHPGGDRPRRERVPAVVDAAVLDPRCAQSGRPLAVPELLRVDVAAAGGREQERRVDPGRHRLDRVHDAGAERHPAPLAARLLRLLHPALRVDPLDAEDARV